MAAEFSYPPTEHYVFPKDTVEVLDDELHYYRDGSSFRAGVIGLGRMYAKTPFLLSCKKYATLMRLACHGAEQPGPALALDPHFYAGEILATHRLLRPAPKLARQHVLWQDILEPYADGPTDFDPSNDLLKEAVDELTEFRDHTWQELFDQQYPKMQEKLVDVTVRMYDDIPNAGVSEDRFTTGYLFAANLIVSALNPDNN